MSVRGASIAFLWLALAGCDRLDPTPDCLGAPSCLQSEHGVVVGRDDSARRAAVRELGSAAATHRQWFDGRPASPGLVLLDPAAKAHVRRIRGTRWTLTYDLAIQRAAESLAGPPQIPAGGAARDERDPATPFSVSRSNGDFDVARPGVLAHEICHRHALRAFDSAWRGKTALPDMLDEVAAISCETDALRASRLDLFARLFAAGELISWNGFLATRHPLKTDPEMIRTLARLGKAGAGAVTFDIEPGSAHEGKVALFYSQAAAFGDFVAARSCRGRRAIGALLTTYDPRQGLDRWLRDRGAALCLPRSLGEFEPAFEAFVRRKG